MLPSTDTTASAPALSFISWLDPTPHKIAVYASPWSSPSTTQHSLPGGRYPLPGPDFHRLDHASFAWRTVFEPFYRIGDARDPDTGDFGLGLCVTRSIVWEHGGDIILGIRKGGGLRVSMKLPIGQWSMAPDQEGTRSNSEQPEPS
jgi:hypothetical protein